jgi:hypothetical protein
LMKWFRMLCFVAATGAAVRQAPAHAATPAKKISIEYRGRLKDALKKIASQGGINLVASGDLSEEVEVLLYDVSPEEALKTLAANYHLRIDRSGSIWTLRPITAAEQVAMPASPPSPPAPPAPPAPEKEDRRPTEADESSASDRAAREAEKALTDSSTDREKPLNRTELRKKLREIGKRGRHPGRNDRVAQGSLIVAEGETVRNATAMGGSLVVNGSVTGDAVALGGSVTVNGHVSGGVVAMGGGVHLGPNAVVEGDVVAVGGEVTKDEGAEVGGDQTSSGALASLGIDRLMQRITKDAAKMSGGTPSEDSGHHPWLRGWHFGLPGFLLRFAFLFFVGLMLMVFAPTRMHQIEADLKNEPIKCGLVGLVGFVALIPLLIMLAITIVGLLVVPVVLFLACLGVAMGMSALANEIGMRLPIFRGRKTQALILAVGTLVLLLVAKVPYLGPLAIAVLMTIAFGAAIRTRFGQAPKGVPQPI